MLKEKKKKTNAIIQPINNLELEVADLTTSPQPIPHSSPTPKTFINRLRYTLTLQHTDLKKVAEDTGIPYSSLSAYFSGRRKPGIEALTQILEYTGVSADWLLMGKGEMKPVQNIDTPMVAPLFGKIVEALERALKDFGGDGNTLRAPRLNRGLYNMEEAAFQDRMKRIKVRLNIAADIYNQIAAEGEAKTESIIQENIDELLSDRDPKRLDLAVGHEWWRWTDKQGKTVNVREYLKTCVPRDNPKPDYAAEAIKIKRPAG